ncbi:MAG: DUF2892 domain-containing protein [Acidobacteriia bacterium]|nr:DUF2892 domain-containing protein [Terriglobia bacterium]
MFRKNVGGADRAVRLVLGLILSPAGLLLLSAKHSYGLIVLIAGLAGLFTALTGFCGLYLPFRFSTARREKVGQPVSPFRSA